MGLIIHDTLVLPSGISITDSYASFRYSNMVVHCISPQSNTVSNAWQVQTTFSIWKDKNMSFIGAPPLDNRNITVELGPAEMEQPLFVPLYKALQSKFTSTSVA